MFILLLFIISDLMLINIFVETVKDFLRILEKCYSLLVYDT